MPAGAEKRGMVMMARIAMVKALNHGQPVAPVPRKNAAKEYRLIS